MSAPILREASPADAEALARLKLETFRDTFLEAGFGVPYPPEDLAVFEKEAYDPAHVADELADPERKTWVVEADGKLLGYAHVGPTKLPHRDAEPHHGELYQLYVRREAQGMKLGGRLLAVALEHLGATRPGPIWLGVWSGNLRAQAVYAASGFARVGEYEFPVGAWRDQEFILRRG
jgi:ribosomal protein S18 acetylase RimI-like enzyme